MTQKIALTNWAVLDEIPDGWAVDKTAGSPLPCSVFITNGKSVLYGQKRAILRIQKPDAQPEKKEFEAPINLNPIEKEFDFVFPSKTVNDLARKKFQEQILKEIMFDLMVCEIEGWDKMEYILELKKLLNGISTQKPIKETKTQNQLTIFDLGA